MPYVYSVRRRQPAKAVAIVPPEPASVAEVADAPVEAVEASTDDAPVEVPTTHKPRKPRAKKSDG